MFFSNLYTMRTLMNDTNILAVPDLIHIKVDIEDEMTQRRKKMHEDGVYIR